MQGSSPGQKESHAKLSLVKASAAWVPRLCSGVCSFCAIGWTTFQKALIRWRRAGKKDQWSGVKLGMRDSESYETRRSNPDGKQTGQDGLRPS